jgi:arginyl-tRNA synthetase
MQISFDIKKITSFEDASAPFILYNSTRCAKVHLPCTRSTSR